MNTIGISNPRSSLFWLVMIALAMNPLFLFGQGRYSYLCPGSSSSGIAIVDLVTQTLVGNISSSYTVNFGSLNQTGSKLWVTGGNYLLVYGTVSRSLVYAYPYSSIAISRPMFSPDGSKVYVLKNSIPVSLVSYDTTTYARVDSIDVGNNSWYGQPVLSPDGTKLYYNDFNYLYEVSVSTGTILRSLYAGGSTPRDLKLGPDGSLYLVTSSSILLVNPSTFTISLTMNVLNSSPSMITLNRDGTKLFLGDYYSSFVRVFSLPSGAFSDYILNSSGVQDIVLAPTDSLIYIVHNNFSSNVSIYNTRTNSTIRTLSSSSYPVSMVMPLPSDGVPPAPVGGLQLTALSYEKVQITMTASGDDDFTGRASFYQIRYDTVQLTGANFGQAKRLTGALRPSIPGQRDTFLVSNLQGGRTYYFGVRVGDELLNLSTLVVDGVSLPLPPRIGMQPDSLSRIMSDNDSVSLSFALQNTGGSNLDYRISVASISEQRSGGLRREGMYRPASNGGTLGGPRVLIVYASIASAISDVVSKLVSTGIFSQVDTLNAQFSTPTLSQLQAYPAVFVWNDYAFFNSVALGNVLADYVDQGGGVVTGLFATASSGVVGNGQILGRFNTQNYWAIQPGPTSTNHDNLILGAVQLPNHPIMRNVATFIGNHSYRIQNAAITSNAVRIASWSDGSPLIVERTIAGTKRVDLGFFPPSSSISSGELWEASSDGAKIMANALEYVANSGGGGSLRTTFIPDSGSVSPQANQNIQMTVKTNDATAGDFVLTVRVETNDPDVPIKTLPVFLAIRDVTPPRIAIRFFQNEALPQYLNFVIVARESLYAPAISLAVGADTTRPLLNILDTAKHVYNADFELVHAGTLTARVVADDSVGNHATVIRQINVQTIAPGAPAVISSIDRRAQLFLEPGTLDQSLWTTFGAEEDANPVSIGESVGPVYRIGPVSAVLAHPGKLSIEYARQERRNDLNVGIYVHTQDGFWEYVPTEIDIAQKRVRANVQKLGEYRVLWNPAIESKVVETIPRVFELAQNFPNPFNPATKISYGIPRAGLVEFKVFDILGRTVRTLVNEFQAEGRYEVSWDGRNSNGNSVSSGVYFYRLSSGATTLERKMMILK